MPVQRRTNTKNWILKQYNVTLRRTVTSRLVTALRVHHKNAHVQSVENGKLNFSISPVHTPT